jgi:hypothetical protein
MEWLIITFDVSTKDGAGEVLCKERETERERQGLSLCFSLLVLLTNDRKKPFFLIKNQDALFPDSIVVK